MAEALCLLIGKIVSAVEEKAFLISGVRDEVNELKHELASMRSFLEDADAKKAQTSGEKTWVASVREIAFEVEDILDEFLYQVNNRHRQRGKIRTLLHKVFHFPKDLWLRHQLAVNLQSINKRIKDISERNQRYHVEQKSSCFDPDKYRQREFGYYGESSLFVKDEDLVGTEDAKQKLLAWIMNTEPQRTVTSVVGMGGVGKTTLVARAYNCPIAKQNFDCFAWVTISQTYKVIDVLKSMIKEFDRSIKGESSIDLTNKSYRELLSMIVDFLKLKRYLIVFDDVWSCNFWKDIQVALPDERQRSRVIITTRMEGVALSSFGVRTNVHRVEPLSLGDAWTLFFKKAFSSKHNRCCPPEFKEIAQDLVAKCEGLPLAIVALGGVMSSKYLVSDWRNVYNSLSWELSHNPELEHVQTILFLSFNDLPHRLKNCFLYCCLFPEDFLIKRKRIIRLWMAEGFVEEVRGLTPEEVAESYLMELIRRSMLQVVNRNAAGRPKMCKMHDLLRELALLTSEQEKFCAFSYGQAETNIPKFVSRRLSIQTYGSKIKSWNYISKLRSLLVFAIDMISPSLETLGRGFQLLTVLDLEDVPIENLPDELVDLFNLRYLNLKGTMVKKLPKSIGRLSNLETLHIRDSRIEAVPDGITKLHNLRHLIMYRYNYEHGLLNYEYVYGAQAPSKICNLKNLQVLACVQADADLIKRIRNMTQLKRIGITKVREVDGDDLCAAIQKMSLLHYLFVMATDENEYLRMDTLTCPPSDIKTLILVGKLGRVPCWFSSLRNVTQLYLHWSRFSSEDPFPVIGQLPNLAELDLVNAREGIEHLCFGTGFHKLKELYLAYFPQLNKITIDRGVMPSLLRLQIIACSRLRTLPHGIEHLEHLQELTLVLVSNELKRSTYEGSNKHPKVKHISRIRIR